MFDRLYSTVDNIGIFQQRYDTLNKQGIHSLKRVVTVMRMLAYGVAADSLDEVLQISESSVDYFLLQYWCYCRQAFHTIPSDTK